jgi:hypothetical protein
MEVLLVILKKTNKELPSRERFHVLLYCYYLYYSGVLVITPTERGGLLSSGCVYSRRFYNAGIQFVALSSLFGTRVPVEQREKSQREKAAAAHCLG